MFETRPRQVFRLGWLLVLSVAAHAQTPVSNTPTVGAQELPSDGIRPNQLGFWIRPHHSAAALGRMGLGPRLDCMNAAVEKYHADTLALGTSLAAKRRATMDAIDRDYREFLARQPEKDPALSPQEQRVIDAAKERVANGQPAVRQSDPFCMMRCRVSVLQTGHEAFAGEAAARAILATSLAECADPPLSPEERARLDARLLVEASSYGVEFRHMSPSADPGLLLAFDIYVELENSMRAEGPLASLPRFVLSVRDLNNSVASPAAIKAQAAILACDADLAQVYRRHIALRTSRSPEALSTDEAMLQLLKTGNGVMRDAVRRRWQLVTDIAAILRESGHDTESGQWELQAGTSMFPSAFEPGLSEQFMSTMRGNADVSPQTLEALNRRFLVFEQARAAIRKSLAAAIADGALLDGYHDADAESKIKALRRQIADMDITCGAELTTLASQSP